MSIKGYIHDNSLIFVLFSTNSKSIGFTIAYSLGKLAFAIFPVKDGRDGLKYLDSMGKVVLLA